jgi:uncharacterized protein
MINPFLSMALEGKNNGWRYACTLALISFFSIAPTVILILIAFAYTGSLDFWNWPPTLMLVVAMVPFGFNLLGLWIGVKFIHGRSMLGLVTPVGRIRWKRIWLSFVIWLVLSGVSDFAIWLWKPGNLYWSFTLESFLPFFFLVLILVPIQTSTEELVFRGYLTQGFGLLAKGMILPLLVPSIVFGLLHSFNLEAQVYDFGVMICFYIAMGLLLGWITLQSQGLELALGLHLANNLYASLITTYPGSSITSPALFTYRNLDVTLSLVVLIIDAIIYLIILHLISRLQKTNSV